MFADMILKSKRIFTAKSNLTDTGFVAIKGNKILAIGTDAEKEQYVGENTKIYELGEKFIMPGFIDAHMHFFMGTAFESKNLVDLSSSKSEQECITLIKTHLDANPELDHITGWGWFMVNWSKGASTPSKESIDRVIPNIPVYMFCADGHTCWINSKAMEECGIKKSTTVPFGSIGKDKNGEPNGLLFEIAAESFVMDKAFHVSSEEWPILLTKMMNTLSKYGITSVTDLSTSPTLEMEPSGYAQLLEAHKKGNLQVRFHLYPSLSNNTDYTLAKKIQRKYNYDNLRFSGLKQFVDGTTSLYSGYMLEPYTDRPHTCGESNFTQDVYQQLISSANQEGFDVKLHSIGDAAVKLSLDCMAQSISESQCFSVKNSVEHCENIALEDIPKFGENGIIASIQPTHLVLDDNEKIERIGKARARYEWPCRSLLDAGATLAFGTDFPVFQLNPMLGIYAAVERSHFDGTPVGASPQEKITPWEALIAYTYGSALSLNREDDLGTLEEGKLADIVVLNQNPLAVTSEELLNIKPVITIMNGKIVFEEESFHG